MILEAAEVDIGTYSKDIGGHAGCLIFPAHLSRVPLKGIDVPYAIRVTAVIRTNENQFIGD